jgi:hypothetical protein
LKLSQGKSISKVRRKSKQFLLTQQNFLCYIFPKENFCGESKMWKCSNCQEEITKDVFKHCWNCGTAKPETSEVKDEKIEVKPKVEVIPPKLRTPSKLNHPPKKEVPVEKRPTLKPKAPVERKTNLKFKTPQEIKPSASQSLTKKTEVISESQIKEEFEAEKLIEPKIETKSNTDSAYEENFLSQYDSAPIRESSSVVWKIIPVLLWLAAVSGVGYFAYISYQKTENFEWKIAEDFQKFNAQKSQFIFPPLPKMRRGTVIEGSVKAKVLPLNVKTGEVESLFTYLPDDLRPTKIDEVKTLMWTDCENNAVGKYRDGTTGYQEKCTAYLVEKETSKFIAIQEFLGVMPALAKEKEGEDAVGKVFPEKYVAFLREKQPESERGTIQTSSESPNHHIYTKSEFIYAVLLLGLLGAIGLGWLISNLRFSRG